MKNLDTVIQAIVARQQSAVGPLAIELANTVRGLSVEGNGKVKLSLKTDAESRKLLMDLVKKYEKLFGQSSVEVCKDAIKESGVNPADIDLPDYLK